MRESQMNIRDLMIEIRIKCHLTQRALSKKIGVEQSLLSRYEAGKTKPTILTLHKIIKFAVNDAHMDIKISDIEF